MCDSSQTAQNYLKSQPCPAALVATSQRYEELHPQIRIQWDKRTLDEFGHASLADLTQRYDLLIVDHPMLGEVHRDGILLDLKPRLQPRNFIAVQSRPCFERYRYQGRLYALPIDAAAPAASYRPDLLECIGLFHRSSHGIAKHEALTVERTNTSHIVARDQRGLNLP